MFDISKFILSIVEEKETKHNLCSEKHSIKECECMDPDECSFPDCFCNCDVYKKRHPNILGL